METISLNDIIDDAVVNFNAKYTTVASLTQLLDDIDKLPQEKLKNNHNKIEKIRNIICNTCDINKTISNRLRKKIIRQLRRIQLADDNQIIIRTDDGHNNKKELTYDLDDPIICIISQLIENLQRNIMSSTLNIIVNKYFSSISRIMNEYPDRYLEITFEIQECLINYGWQMPDLGFEAVPCVESITLFLSEILTTYLKIY